MGLTRCLTDAVAVLLMTCRPVRCRFVCTQPDGRCDLIGACARGPVAVLSACLTGACRLSGATDKDGSFRMARKARKVIGGVDTHGETHHAAVVDALVNALGRQLADREFRPLHVVIGRCWLG